MRDFSIRFNAEQGKFYRPLEELDIPIYLDKDVKEYFIQKIRSKGKQFSLNETINSLLKKDIEISKGGFSADYGGRLSSVLNVTNLDGNRKSFEGTAEVSLLSAKATLQTPIGSFGSISASYRRTYAGETAKLFYDDIPDYYFYDSHIKAFFDINPDNKLSISLYKGKRCENS